MSKVNKYMRIYTYIITLVASLLWNSAAGQEMPNPESNSDGYWGQKPVQCFPFQKAFKFAQDAGMKSIFGGLGIIEYQVENRIEQDSGFIFLMVNLQQETFMILEIDQTKLACIIARGNKNEFDLQKLAKMTTPSIQTN